MKRIKQTISTFVIALMSLGLTAQAQGQRPYRVTDRTVEQLIRRIENRTDRFKVSLDRALDRSRLDNTRREDNVNQLVTDFEQATNQLRARFNRRESTLSDVQGVLERAAWIDRFMHRHRLQLNAERSWNLLRGDLNQLARYYDVAWNWNNPPRPGDGFGMGLTGTYRLNVARSNNARWAVEQAVRSLPLSQRQRTYDALLRRIEAPDMLALERQGQTLRLASSHAPLTIIEADGREHLEQYPNRRVTSRVRATLSGDQLMISSTGDRATDYSVTFDPINNGRQLRVTRRLYAERLMRPVIVQSIYDRTSDVAGWNVYTGAPDSANAGLPKGEYVVPGGTELVARLSNDLDSRTNRTGDRFTLRVMSPAQFQGATLEGYISNIDSGGRLTGRTEMALNLERIRLTDGRVYPFEGYIERVRAANGETLNVDTEGAVREDESQTDKTIKRTAIGTAIGAIIGAITGGGKGAAIGAAVGAGAGAGSVYVQGRDRLELMSGAEMTIRAVTPGMNARR